MNVGSLLKALAVGGLIYGVGCAVWWLIHVWGAYFTPDRYIIMYIDQYGEAIWDLIIMTPCTLLCLVMVIWLIIKLWQEP